MIKGCLDKGEVILSSFRVSKEYLSLLPNDIYRYEDSEDNTAHQAHCVVLTGHGIVETKEKDDDLGEMVTGLQPCRLSSTMNISTAIPTGGGSMVLGLCLLLAYGKRTDLL